MSAILKFDFQKKNNYIFQRKWSKLHKKETILHVTIHFVLKQGQIRTSGGPIILSLNMLKDLNVLCSWRCCFLLKAHVTLESLNTQKNETEEMHCGTTEYLSAVKQTCYFYNINKTSYRTCTMLWLRYKSNTPYLVPT